MLNRRMRTAEVEEYVIRLAKEIRLDHPTMSCRAMYHKLRPLLMGRDKFERLCHQVGLVSEQTISPYRTTDSSGVIRFPNLLEDTVLTDIDQAYCSDITYYEMNNRFYYITFILDCFSRRILGYSVSKQLTTECTTLPALEMALKNRGNKIPAGVIFHSDGGGQYYDHAFLQLTNKYQMRNSMCEMAYQNGKAERINGVIKNNYLKFYSINNLDQLQQGVDRAVNLYNNCKPHKELKYITPFNFEKQLLFLKQQTKPKMTESLEAKYRF
jgi:putative transposase